MDFLSLILMVLGFFLLIFIFFFIALPLSIGAPFEPTNKKTLAKMIKFSKVKKGEKVADLGSGNGRVVIGFAKLSAVKEVHGFEINPFLVWISRRKIKKLGLQNKAFIHFGNFWNQNLSEYDIISLFQISFIMGDLEKKLRKELKKGSRVISNTWKFKKWKPKKQEGNVYLYES